MAVPVNSKLPSNKSFSIERIISPSFGRHVHSVLSSEKNQAEPTPERARDSIKPEDEGRKLKRRRVKFTLQQLTQLEASFAKSQYLKFLEVDTLVERLGLEKSTIQNWFQNKRMKLKRKKQKEAATYSQVEAVPCNFCKWYRRREYRACTGIGAISAKMWLQTGGLTSLTYSCHDSNRRCSDRLQVGPEVAHYYTTATTGLSNIIPTIP